jgi:hypothetical protein
MYQAFYLIIPEITDPLPNKVKEPGSGFFASDTYQG